MPWVPFKRQPSQTGLATAAGSVVLQREERRAQQAVQVGSLLCTLPWVLI